VTLLAVMLAGAAGAVARFLVAKLAATHRFPWAVFVVNVVGSGIGGCVLALAERGAVDPDIRLVLLTGLCGGLTTFSTLSVETVQLFIAGRVRTAVASIASNLVLGVGAAGLGYCCGLIAA
jgi:CrcB protein